MKHVGMVDQTRLDDGRNKKIIYIPFISKYLKESYNTQFYARPVQIWDGGRQQKT